jgi:hypothetical protein
MKKIFLSKKVIVSLVGLIMSVLVAAGAPLPAGMESTIIQAIVALIASFNIGQGIADGLSKGRTSAGRDVYD